MSISDDILSKIGVKYEDLTTAERGTLNQWMQALQSNQLTVEMVKSFVGNLRDTIENNLIQEPEFNYILFFKVPNRKQILLKARLKNIMLFDAFLSTPEKAKRALKQQIAGMVSDRK